MHLNTALLFALAGTACSSPLSKRQSFAGDTQNGLKNGGCKPVTVIFARGTTESGNVGTLTGPPFFQALAQQVGANNLAVQGVDYPANVAGFLAGGDADGSKLMYEHPGWLTRTAVFARDGH